MAICIFLIIGYQVICLVGYAHGSVAEKHPDASSNSISFDDYRYDDDDISDKSLKSSIRYGKPSSKSIVIKSQPIQVGHGDQTSTVSGTGRIGLPSTVGMGNMKFESPGSYSGESLRGPDLRNLGFQNFGLGARNPISLLNGLVGSPRLHHRSGLYNNPSAVGSYDYGIPTMGFGNLGLGGPGTIGGMGTGVDGLRTIGSMATGVDGLRTIGNMGTGIGGLGPMGGLSGLRIIGNMGTGIGGQSPIGGVSGMGTGIGGLNPMGYSGLGNFGLRNFGNYNGMGNSLRHSGTGIGGLRYQGLGSRSGLGTPMRYSRLGLYSPGFVEYGELY